MHYEGAIRAMKWIGLVILVVSCQSTAQSVPEQLDKKTPVGSEPREASLDSVDTQDASPKRIIFFVGDGMGVPALAATSYHQGAPLQILGMEEFGLMGTHEYEFVTTDSAASATAKATGEKTHFNAVSVTPGTGPENEEEPAQQLRHIAEAAKEAKWKTGLVATSRINHATPAAFAAHRHHRQRYEDIALDMSESGVDVLLGAGYEFFNDREDGRDLLEEMTERGYAIADSASGVRQASATASQLVGLMHARDMPWVSSGEREMDLDEMVEHAIEVLDRDNSEGFFLMVEGSFIDWAGHNLDGEALIAETADMDRAVKQALDYARSRDDTLVVVSSDHETGAMDLIDGPTAQHYLDKLGGDEAAFERTVSEGLDAQEKRDIAPPFAHMELGDPLRFGPPEAPDKRLTTTFGFISPASRARMGREQRFSANHTPLLVPVFAQGAGAWEAASVHDNADLGRLFMGWIDGPDAVGRDVSLPSSPPAVDDEQPKNVILVVGSGYGVASLTTSYYHHGTPALFDMSKTATVATHGIDALSQDAAGTATALASGHRTRRGALGMIPEDGEGQGLVAVESAMMTASKSGKATGLVTTSMITDPTPAAFFANQSDARDHRAIMMDLTTTHGDEQGPPIDFIAAARSASIKDSIGDQFSSAGYRWADTWTEIVERDANLFLLSADKMGRATTRQDTEEVPTLSQMMGGALAQIGDAEKGFFLVVEAGGMDAAKRDLNRGQWLLDELEEFNDAIEAALEFGRTQRDTLVIVTSDRDHTLSPFDNHYGFYSDRCGVLTECGGEYEVQWFGVASDDIRHGQGLDDRDLQGEYSPPQIGMQYTWLIEEAARMGNVEGATSANFVPLYADGPQSSSFGGFMEQPEVGQWLVNWASSRR